MAQRTRTTKVRAALAGAAVILGAGLTGCMGDGKKPSSIKQVGPNPNMTTTKTGTGAFPTGPGGTMQPAGGMVGNTYPQTGLGAGAVSSTNPTPGGLPQPGVPGGIGYTPSRPTTGAGAPGGTPVPAGGLQQPGTPTYPSTTPGYNPGAMTPGAQSNYGGQGAMAQYHPVADVASPPAPPPPVVPSLSPPVDPAPPAASYPLSPAGAGAPSYSR